MVRHGTVEQVTVEDLQAIHDAGYGVRIERSVYPEMQTVEEVAQGIEPKHVVGATRYFVNGAEMHPVQIKAMASYAVFAREGIGDNLTEDRAIQGLLRAKAGISDVDTPAPL